MKKLLALSIAIVMMMAIALPVFAATPAAPGRDVAADVVFDDTDDGEATAGQTYVKYGVAQTYTVSIPADITLTEAATDGTNQSAKYVYGTETLGVSDVVIAGDEVLRISISSAQYDNTNGWTLKDLESDNSVATEVPTTPVSDDVNYKINKTTYLDSTAYAAGTSFENNEEILTQNRADGNAGTDGASQTITLYFSSKGTAQEGTYRDTLTFTVEITDDYTAAP